MAGIGSIAREPAGHCSSADPYLTLMRRADAHAKRHKNLYVPVLSPAKALLLGPHKSIDVDAIHAAGFKVVPWTANDIAATQQLIEMHVDGIISDRPDFIAGVLWQARQRARGDAGQMEYLDRFDAEGHRGARGLRPENTLPAFEAGLDHGISSIETDTGVTVDRQSLISHDQFLNPQSCRRADGKPYTLDDRVYIRDISMAEAQQTFICDKLHFGPEQRNDLVFSPVSVAFAGKEQMISPYSPTNVAQLFRFVDFYVQWYESGEGKSSSHAEERAATGRRIHFNLETKILPPGYSDARIAAVAYNTTIEQIRNSGQVPPSAFSLNCTVSPELFVDTLCGFVRECHMEQRTDIQSFDFRTLLLVQERYPEIRACYLTESPALLNSDFTPEGLRAP